MTSVNLGDSKLLSKRVVQEAISWQIRLNSQTDDDASRQEFIEWHQSEPDHQLAWKRIETIGSEFYDVLSALPEKNIIIPTLDAASKNMQRRDMLKLLSVVLTTGTVAGLNSEYQWLEMWSADYSTAKGERRTVQLADGTVLLFNTNTAVDIRFTRKERLLILRRGEVFVTSGADSKAVMHRPLLVESEHARFQAIGTRFLVRRNEINSHLMVEQGKVEISNALGNKHIVNAGESYDVSVSDITVYDNNKLKLDAWLQGMLVVDNIRLVDFLAEVSRYRLGYLNCDPSIANLRLSGVFQLDDPDQIVAMLPQLLPVQLVYRTKWWARILPN